MESPSPVTLLDFTELVPDTPAIADRVRTVSILIWCIVVN